MLDSGFNFASETGATVSSQLLISLSFSGLEATNISLTLSHPEVHSAHQALILKANHFNVERLKGRGTPVTIETDFTVDNRIPLTEQFFELTATYDYMSGPSLQTGTSCLLVPISLQTYCYLVAPVKEADFKLTLEANAELPPLSEIFRDFIQETAPDAQYYANPNVLSFLLNEGSICTLIVAKSSSNCG
jgi:PTHB1 C-terminus